jgi:segregation and condensation protein B
MTFEELKAVLEALLFVAPGPGPVPTEELARALPEEEHARIEEALAAVGSALHAEGKGIALEKIAGGWRLVTRRDLGRWVKEFLKVRRSERLSRQALETMAVVAYRQPVTAPEITEIRGVDATATLQTLLERGLVRIAGRKKVVGKPFLYGTTREFLIRFGLDRIEDLPSLDEFTGLLEETAGPGGGPAGAELPGLAASVAGESAPEEAPAPAGEEIVAPAPEGEEPVAPPPGAPDPAAAEQASEEVPEGEEKGESEEEPERTPPPEGE